MRLVTSYTLSDFDLVPSAKAQVQANLQLDQLPAIEQVKALATWTEEMFTRFDRDAEFFAPQPDGRKEDRSAALAAFSYLAAEHGWTDEQIMAALYDMDDRWGKYTARRDRDKRLIDFVNRARSKVGYDPVTDIDLSALLAQNDPAIDQETPSKLIYGAQEFVDMEFKVEWLLDGLLAQNGIGLTTGYPGVGKTQFILQLGSTLALGHERFLKWTSDGATKKVLFLSLEMGKAPLNLFMGQIAKSYEDRDRWNRNFLIAPFGTPVPLDTKEGQAFLNALMDEHMPDVLLIDSLQKISSKELTDELAVKSLIHYLSVLRDKYKTSIVIVHHNRKKPNDGQKKQVELSDVYGSTYLTTDVDFVLSLKLLNPQLIGVDMLKNRLGPTLDPFEMYRDENLHFGLDFENLQEQFGTKGGEGGGILGI